MKNLKNRLNVAYKLATDISRKSQLHQKHNYDLKVRGNKVEIGDRVLVKAVRFDGKHKLANKWEEFLYIIISQPNPSIPVYEIKREDNEST